MNILLITEFFPESDKCEITGGVENRAYNISKLLSKTNNVYVIASKQSKQKKYSKISNIKVTRIGPIFEYTNTGNLFKRILFGINVLFQLPFFILKNKIQVVDGLSFFCYPAALFSKLFGIKSFLTYHEVWLNNWIKHTNKLGFLGEIFERMILFFSKLFNVKIIAVSKNTKRALEKHGVKNISVIANGIDFEKYNSIKINKNKLPSICFAGRLVNHKRGDDLIKAVSIVKKNIPKIECNIIGDGHEKNKLKKLSNKFGLNKNIKFLGYVKNHSEVIKTMKSSKLFIHPGTVEGFGIVLIEAMACGTPYVASDIEVFKEITKNGQGGLFFKATDHKDLAKKIINLINNEKLYKVKQKLAIELAKKYDWENIVKDLQGAYNL